jgi:hypothetical protein
LGRRCGVSRRISNFWIYGHLPLPGLVSFFESPSSRSMRRAVAYHPVRRISECFHSPILHPTITPAPIFILHDRSPSLVAGQTL